MDEATLIRQARRGDRQAFGELFRLHVGDAVRAAYAVTRDWEAAEDAVQEAFIRAFAALPSFDPERPFRPWLFRIVVREARRAAGRLRRTVPVPEAGLPQPVRTAASAEAEVLRRDRARALGEAIRMLGPRRAVAVVLKYLLGFKEEEIAGLLGVPRSTVKSRLHEARRDLGRLLGPDLGDESEWIPGSAG
ncbi:RNA polymerase sigma factor [Caldinitratiruptor microaerophilus]|uniref:RNA polymerase sigma factor n=1 Tax=Caldinitratiruptor microaerophilus TaxID=671077 RepID=A0AA35G9J8_9FIRM|nr:RNA polymerase sigma factor [Caldinitratiruptor microaerophilus]BDG62270.1 RNA polymerase sigma factor [Caldinitratiruptor microaerophilus]